MTYNFPVYGTQGGGLAKEEYGVFVFIEAPDCPGLAIGDKVPDEWDLAPANAKARAKSEQDCLLDDDLFMEVF